MNWNDVLPQPGTSPTEADIRSILDFAASDEEAAAIAAHVFPDWTPGGEHNPPTRFEARGVPARGEGE